MTGSGADPPGRCALTPRNAFPPPDPSGAARPSSRRLQPGESASIALIPTCYSMPFLHEDWLKTAESGVFTQLSDPAATIPRERTADGPAPVRVLDSRIMRCLARRFGWP